MNLTSKSRYALKIMLDLSKRHGKEPVKRHDIVARQGIPVYYMDKIILKLRNGGLIESTRGPMGGYLMCKTPQQTTVWDVFSAVEDGIYPALCVDQHAECEFEGSCSTSEPWQIIFSTFKSSLERILLSDLNNKPSSDVVVKEGTFECRSSRDGGLFTNIGNKRAKTNIEESNIADT